MVKTKKFILVKHFVGLPKTTDLQLMEENLPQLQEGEFLAQAVFLSVDPYLRSYEPNRELGSVFLGSQVALITESKNPQFPTGKYVIGHFGWQTHTISDGTDKEGFGSPHILPDMGGLPVSIALGVLGMPGNTAYFGFLEICQPKVGETVVVTAAGGAVGSHVAQIAKIKGCTVIGIAGDDEKGKWLTEDLGIDHFINYKKSNVSKQLAEFAPHGIDIYFDNVGGEISSMVLQQMNEFGRISVCGAISASNADISNLPKATMVQKFFVKNQLKMEGFFVRRWNDRWSEGIQQNLQWLKEGKLQYKETITTGFENVVAAFIDMLQGGNTGKAVIKI